VVQERPGLGEPQTPAVRALLDWHHLPGPVAPHSYWSGERDVGRSKLGWVEGGGDYGEPDQAGR
jgi:hypothetical protein